MTTRFILSVLPYALPLYVVRFHIGPIPTTLLEIIILFSLVAWLVERRVRTPSERLAPAGARRNFSAEKLRTRRRSLNEWYPILLFLFAGIIAVFVAPDKLGALGLWRAYFLEPALVFLMLSDIIRTDEDRRRLIRSCIGVTLIVAAWAVLQRVGVLPIPSPWDVPPVGIRATGPFPFPNAVALFVVPLGALCLSLRTPRYLPAVGFAAAFLAAFLAKSDGGMIALLAALGVVLIMKQRTRMPAILAATVLLVSGLSITAIREPLAEKILFRDWSGKVRLVMWDETAMMLKDNPILGAGLGAYPDAIAPYHAATWMEVFQYPHNILLNFWSEIGLLGLIAFGWILVRWSRSNPRVVLPIIAAVVVHGLVDVPYFKNDLAVMFWMLVAATQTGDDAA